MLPDSPPPDGFTVSPFLPISWPFDVSLVVTIDAQGATEDEARDQLTEILDRVSGGTVLLGFLPDGKQIWARDLIADPVTAELAPAYQDTELDLDEVQFFDPETRILDQHGNTAWVQPVPLRLSISERITTALRIVIKGY